MEQEITNEAKVHIVATVQPGVAKARHAAAISELKSVRNKMEALTKDFSSLVAEKDMALKKAEEAVYASKEIEKIVDELRSELLITKESLEYARAAHLEVEEQIIVSAVAREGDCRKMEKELKQTEEELERLNQQLLSVKDIKSKLDTASTSLLDLKAKLATCMEAKLVLKTDKEYSKSESERKFYNSIQAAIVSTRKELEEERLIIDKANAKVNYLKVAAISLQSQLESEKSSYVTIKQREGMASDVVKSIEFELNKIKLEIDLVRIKEKEAKEKMADMPKQLQQVAQEADEAKSLAQVARKELRKAKDEKEQAKAGAHTMASTLHAVLQEIEAAKTSEKLAQAAIKALVEIKMPQSTNDLDLAIGRTLSLEEYYDLSKQAQEAEEQANMRVAAAISNIEVAKESELRSIEKLEGVQREKAAGDEALKTKEGNLGIEQELRNYRPELEQQNRVNDSAAQEVSVNFTGSPTRSFEERKESKNNFDQIPETTDPAYCAWSPNSYVQGSSTEMYSSPEGKVVKQKRRSLFPQILKLLPKERREPK